MSIKISLELSDNDLSHFRELMQLAMEKIKNLPEQEVIKKAQDLCKQMESANLPDFVSQRLGSLKMLISALDDEEWQIPEDEKEEILTSIAYFCEPQDLIPDNIPGLGYLDDAIMIELVIQDMSLDLQAHESFCSYRSAEENRRGSEANVNRESWLTSTRSELRSGLRRNKSISGARKIFSRIM